MKVFNPLSYITFFIFLTFSYSLLAATPKHQHDSDSILAPSMGLHGMLLFGNESALFASHLPMFHTPHNAQVIVQLSFNQKHIQQQMITQMAQEHSDSVWTIVPQHFDLARLSPTAKHAIDELTVDVFEGHFERGGHLRWAKKKIKLEKVLVFSPLSLTEVEDTRSTTHYFTVNNSASDRTQFLVKKLTHRPDADHILKLTGVKQALSEYYQFPLKNHLYTEVQQIQSQFKNNETTKVSQIYLELNELQ
ncbi:hypothetical protein [Shewanella gaetbuli]|uniref:Uncharacterized protein n=1 Tax=Shewanella gaetbuli TaxID=220752 RepID=A0A9X1ZJA9_9GAMM|nr:hypothetical protein [Shewanella gaetbuli]MCL1142793.1 hypothetical protein [Shewanella gaetbuli]